MSTDQANRKKSFWRSLKLRTSRGRVRESYRTAEEWLGSSFLEMLFLPRQQKAAPECRNTYAVRQRVVALRRAGTGYARGTPHFSVSMPISNSHRWNKSRGVDLFFISKPFENSTSWQRTFGLSLALVFFSAHPSTPPILQHSVIFHIRLKSNRQRLPTFLFCL